MTWGHLRRAIAWSLVLAICRTPSLAARANSWNKVRYIGGATQPKVDPYDWNTTLAGG
jgi:hypothetical protein